MVKRASARGRAWAPGLIMAALVIVPFGTRADLTANWWGSWAQVVAEGDLRGCENFSRPLHRNRVLC